MIEKIEGFRMGLDPCSYYGDVNVRELVALCGLLPAFIATVAKSGEEDLIKGMSDQYGFGVLHEMKGGEVTEAGVYQYPDDPDLYPILAAEIEGKKIYQYHYGIVAIEQDDGAFFVTRMD